MTCISSHRDSETAVRPEAELFIGLARAGVSMTVMTQADSVYAGRMAQAGIRIIDFAPQKKLSLAAVRFIRRHLKHERCDILHLFNNRAIANGLLAATGLPVRVVTYRGQTGNVNRLNPLARLTHLSPRIDRIVCVAEAVRRDLVANGVPPDRAVTIYKGHDLAWYEAPPADLAEFGIAEGACVIGLVANARPRKGIPVLLEAARQLPAEAPCEILLVGSGMERYAGLTADLPAQVRVHMPGFRRDADRLIAACQVAVLPALRREGLPKSVIEAMVHGIVPVVSDTGGNVELVENEVSGLVVPSGDAAALAAALARLIADPALRARLGAAARTRIATQFSLAQTVARTLAVYRELAG
ncbi:MAG: glycosyltransferase family 4 protein [Chromatiales bacterium]|nr:glycosyltransferase family 4 protein [Chromatiales bacterium]